MHPAQQRLTHRPPLVSTEQARVQLFRSSLLRNLAQLFFLAAVYYGCGRFGLGLASVNPHATALWAPTGISIAALLLLGYRAWPAIFVGAFLVNLHVNSSIVVSAGIGVGNTLEALVGAYLVNQFANGTRAFYRTKDVFRFVCYAGFVATAISATIGVFILSSSGLANWHDLRSVWLTWWIGDVLGALTLTPFLVLVLQDPQHTSTLEDFAEIFFLLAGLSIVCVLIFGPPSLLWSKWYGLAFLCLPFAVWTAFRFCPRESAGTNLVLSGFATWGSIAGFGPFAANKDAPLLLGCFVGVSCSMSLLIAASVFQRRRTEEELLGLHSVMQFIVDDKTQLLEETVDALHDEVLSRIKAERSANKISEPLQQIATTIPHVLWLIDVIEPRILYVSPAYELVWGRSCQSLYADPFSWVDAVHPDDHDNALIFFNREISSNLYEVEYRIRRPDGTERWIHDRGYAIRDASGRIARIAGLAVDITHKKNVDIAHKKNLESQLRQSDPGKHETI